MNLDLATTQGLQAHGPGAMSEVASAGEVEAGDAIDVPDPPNNLRMLEPRVAEIRDRFRVDFYDQDSTREEIARRILRSGDL